jgi:hypothetical protein
MLPVQILLVAFLAYALRITWRRARESAISRREAFAWSLLWCAAAVVILLPQTTTRIAQLVGVGRGVDLVLYGSIAGLFFLVFRLFVAVDKVERQITDLVRRDALKGLPPEAPQDPHA